MPCYRPLSAWQTDEGAIVFGAEPRDCRRALVLPCGKCIGCYLERSRQWAVRCMHEAQMHDVSCFITLTYDDEHLPLQRGLDHKVFQKFCKKARHKLGPFRFFMCGEYGELHDRPHYHACLFGVSFPDRKKFKLSGSGSYIYTSDTLSALWPYGYSSVGDLTFESAAYVARYVTKKADRPAEERLLRFDDYGVVSWLPEEYGRASNRPGIGASWWRKYGQEVLNRGNVVMRGVEMKVPRYYAKLCKDPAFDWVEFQGEKLFRPEENTEDRLAVREVVAKARLAFKKRSSG